MTGVPLQAECSNLGITREKQTFRAASVSAEAERGFHGWHCRKWNIRQYSEEQHDRIMKKHRLITMNVRWCFFLLMKWRAVSTSCCHQALGRIHQRSNSKYGTKMSFKQQKPLSPMNCESYTNIITNWQKVNKTGGSRRLVYRGVRRNRTVW